MSDSVRPHRRQPTRLHHPWDPLGKNTGVGCHFLLQRMKVKSESEVAQSCPTLSDPMDCSPPGSSVHGIFQARVLEWVAIAFSRGQPKGDVGLEFWKKCRAGNRHLEVNYREGVAKHRRSDRTYITRWLSKLEQLHETTTTAPESMD